MGEAASDAAAEAAPRPVLRVGVTGGIGSGKSTVAGLLAGLGAGLVDADAIARELTAIGGAALPAIVAAFGPEVLDTKGALDRAAMRRRAFSDPSARRRLEGILHPMIRAASDDRAARLARQRPYLVFDIPLLVEAGDASARVDRVLVVDCPVALQRSRAMRRSGLTSAEADAIIARQARRAGRLAVATDVVFNADGLAELEEAAGRLHAAYLRTPGGPQG